MELESFSMEEALALLKERSAKANTISYVRECSRAFVHRGDYLAAKFALDYADYGGSLVIVDGNVNVEKFWDSWVTVVVLGDLHAGYMSASEYCFVEGDCVISRGLYGDSGSNKSLFVSGKLGANVVVMHGHSLEVDGAIDCPVVIDAAERTPPRGFTHGFETMSDVLDATLLDEDGDLDVEQLEERMSTGGSVLR